MEPALARSRHRLTEVPRRRRMRLMIVDDSVVARAVLSRMIESDPGFEIAAVAASAEEAVCLLDQCRVDAVILERGSVVHAAASAGQPEVEVVGGGEVQAPPRLEAEGAVEAEGCLRVADAEAGVDVAAAHGSTSWLRRYSR